MGRNSKLSFILVDLIDQLIPTLNCSDISIETAMWELRSHASYKLEYELYPPFELVMNLNIYSPYQISVFFGDTH